MERKAKAATESGALLLITAGILVAVNALSALGGYKRIDTTKNERFTLSKGSGNLLHSMKKQMHVDAYVTKGLPKLDVFVRDLRDLLQEYKTNSGGNFDYTIIEAKDEDQKKAAKDAGLVEQPFGEASDTDDKAAVTQGFMGLVFNYGGDREAIKFLPPDRSDGLEFWITNKIREVRDKEDNITHKIGVLSGHDEMKLTEPNLVPANAGKPNMQQIIGQNFPFYTFVDVDLKNGESKIDEAIDGLVITQPAKDLTEKELRQIDAFVLKGKSLAIFASAVNIKAGDSTMNATLATHGLEKLLDGYGITLNKDVVIDFGRSFRVPVMTQSGVANARFPQFLQVMDDSRFTGNEQLLDTGFPAFFRMQELIVPFASSVDVHPDKQPDGVKMSVVARSTPRALHETTDQVDLRPFRQWKPKGEWAQFGIAATAEGTLKTAFPSGDKMGVDSVDKAAKPARVFIMASSEFLANPLAREGNGPEQSPQMAQMMGPQGDEQLLQLAGPYAQEALTNAILSFKNTLDWLTGDTDLLAVSAKILSEPSLVYGDVSKPSFADDTDEQLKKRDEEMKAAKKIQQHWVEGALILLLPLLFVAYGILRWRMRQTSRANVSLA